MYKVIVTLTLHIITMCMLNGQNVQLGIGIGGLSYWGDLNAPQFVSNLSQMRLAWQFSVYYPISNYFSVKSNVIVANVEGSDRKSTLDWQIKRNLSFESPILDIALLSEIYPIGNNDLSENRHWAPFVIFGVSWFSFSPRTYYMGQLVELQPLGTEGQGIEGFEEKYNTHSYSLTFGFGIKFRLSYRMVLMIEGHLKRTSTDYLDDVSGDYVAYETLLQGNGELAAKLGNRMGEYYGLSEPIDVETGSQRGGERVQDYLVCAMATVYYNIFDKSRKFSNINTRNCPKF